VKARVEKADAKLSQNEKLVAELELQLQDLRTQLKASSEKVEELEGEMFCLRFHKQVFAFKLSKSIGQTKSYFKQLQPVSNRFSRHQMRKLWS
jgi:hypothetical protein